MLLLNVYDGQGRSQAVEIDAQTLAMMIGCTSVDYDTLMMTLRRLMETVVEWDLLGE